ncbi:MAG: GNAT family N-acetyltransferase [Thermoleophilaceae bacterium]
MARVDDAEGWRRLIASLAQWSRNIDGASAGMRTIERDGAIATVAPAAPERAVVNDVVYWDAAGLESAYDEIAAAYDEAGIQAWTVWVPETEPGVADMLAARGHVLDSDPEAMILDLDAVERPPLPPGFTTDVDASTIARINDVAYGLPGSFERALSGMRRGEDVHLYAAGDGDEPSSCLMAFDHGGDCSIWLVATLPQARGNGLARALMGHALADGRERGCTTSTLEATDLGRPVYERLGYRSLGEIQMWEKRAA